VGIIYNGGVVMLSLLIWLPIIVALLVLFAGNQRIYVVRFLSFSVSLLVFLLSLVLWYDFDNTTHLMQFVEHVDWIPSFGINYHLGIDGISLPFIILTTFSTVILVLASWNVQTRIAHYMAAFLVMGGITVGVFAALDGILFYLFWESSLIPMLLIIGIWGGDKRVYAAIKFFLYTFLGSVLMLIAFLYMQNKGGSFNILDMHTLPLLLKEQQYIFWALFIAFAVKIPMFPFHTWLPSAHVQAPAGGSVILAAIMLKMGGYGFLRFSLPITPDASLEFADVVMVLSVIAIVYIGFIALKQSDMKKLVAYSSISHMGFVTLGTFAIFAASTTSLESALIGLEGGIVQMISHGFISAAMFLIIGVLYDRMHTREIENYGGVAKTMPLFAGFVVLFAMANSGLPGTSGFVGEFMVIIGVASVNVYYAIFAAITLIIGAAYTLWMVKRVIWGEVTNDNVATLSDIGVREFIVFSILAIFVLLIGVYPQPLIEMIEVSSIHLIEQALTSKL
jgi:NADH-quinone oxidoreductase subunit M